MLQNWIFKIGRWIDSNGRFSLRLPPNCRRRPTTDTGLGPAGEKLAARHLKQLGYRILARGHRQRLGEIDLIALDGDCIVFVEVKARSSTAGGQPHEAVDRSKQEKLTRAALIYLKKNDLLEKPSRFDVISILSQDQQTPQIRHIPNAFEAIGTGQMFR